MTKDALRLVDSESSSAYARALAALREDTCAWWREQLTWEPEDYEENQTPIAPMQKV
jgi:hypothetical protein